MTDLYKIIYADDDPVGRTKVCKILEKAGFSVKTAEGGTECIRLAEDDHPDLIILDVMMADLNGFDTSQKLRQLDATCDIPIIFLTGLDNRFSIIKALQAGAIDYIIKPVESKDLIAKITAALKIKNLLHDKLNLMRMNQAMIDNTRELLDNLGVMKRVNQMKSDLEDNSINALDLLADARKHVESYDEDAALEAISQTEASLQFSDRVAQQLNELAKVFSKIHDTINKTSMLTEEERTALDSSSTDSVLDKKCDQAAVDDLLSSLDI